MRQMLFSNTVNNVNHLLFSQFIFNIIFLFQKISLNSEQNICNFNNFLIKIFDKFINLYC